VVLFRRTAKGLELTDEALAGLEPLRAGFLHFEDAVQAMQVGQSAHVYTIASPRDFFAAWLAPRLAAFRAANPDVRIVLVDGDATDFTEANLDLAVRLAEGPGDLEGVALGAPKWRSSARAHGSPGRATPIRRGSGRGTAAQCRGRRTGFGGSGSRHGTRARAVDAGAWLARSGPDSGSWRG
jgi:LysR family glycine cleavage system transcriptional activator